MRLVRFFQFECRQKRDQEELVKEIEKVQLFGQNKIKGESFGSYMKKFF